MLCVFSCFLFIVSAVCEHHLLRTGLPCVSESQNSPRMRIIPEQVHYVLSYLGISMSLICAVMLCTCVDYQAHDILLERGASFVIQPANSTFLITCYGHTTQLPNSNQCRMVDDSNVDCSFGSRFHCGCGKQKKQFVFQLVHLAVA